MDYYDQVMRANQRAMDARSNRSEIAPPPVPPPTYFQPPPEPRGVDPASYGGATGGWGEGAGATGTFESEFGGGGGRSRGYGASSAREARGVTGTWDEAPPALAGESMFGVPVPAQPAVEGTGRLPGWLSSPLEAFNSVVRPDSPSAQSYNLREGSPAGVAVSPSLSEPRRAAGDGPLGMGWHRSGVTPQAQQPPAGPLEQAVSGIAPGVTTPQVDPATGALLNASRARLAQEDLATQNANALGNRAAVLANDKRTADWNAEFSRFRATNGADMVLAPENSGYDSQRRAIIEGANQDAARAGAVGKELAGVQDAQISKRSYIDEFAKSQDALSQAERARGASALTGAEAELAKTKAQLGQQEVGQAKEISALRAALQAETDPAKIKVLQNKLLTMMGKQPANKVALIDVDSGTTDVTGQPRYIKQAIDIETGQPIGGQAAGGKARAPAALEDWLKAAKAQNPNASLDELTKYYKDKYAQ